MTPVNNFNRIRNHLKFDDPDKFYFIEVLKRKKDFGYNINGTNNNNRLISYYCVDSLDKYEHIQEEVVQICDATGARCMIHLNRRSFRKVYRELQDILKDYNYEQRYNLMYRTYSSACGQEDVRAEKSGEINCLWDYDSDDSDDLGVPTVEEIVSILKEIDSREIFTVPSKSGYHIITKRINMKKVWEHPNFENFLKPLLNEKNQPHKNSPTNLYIPIT